MTSNDLRVLRAVEDACKKFDGFIPHGAADWTGVKRLEKEVMVECCNEYGACQTCSAQHEAPMFTLTVHGMYAIEKAKAP